MFEAANTRRRVLGPTPFEESRERPRVAAPIWSLHRILSTTEAVNPIRDHGSTRNFRGRSRSLFRYLTTLLGIIFRLACRGRTICL